jgi:hypothetical protein
MAFVFSLAGCGGGTSSTPSPGATYTIGGTITGLTAGGLVLTNGGQTASPAAGATSFSFPTAIASGSGYSVTVQTQPTGETCSVGSGSGTVGSSNVTSVTISCAANPTYTIGGTIAGLTASGLVLANGSQTVSPAAGVTSFTFPTAALSGTSYSVTVQTQPSGQTCSVGSGSGTVGSSNVTSVTVSCANPTYTIGGTITGLTASGLVLTDGSQTVSPAAGATSFTFPTAVASGFFYSVNHTALPSGETCSIANWSGTVGSSNVTNVAVTCVASPEVVLYNFQGGTGDGYSPQAGLIMDGSGNLYGTTRLGGSGSCTTGITAVSCGTVFKLTKNSNGTYTESVLHNFQEGPGDGYTPEAGLIMDGSGNLYGTTSTGGAGGVSGGGGGTVFKLTPGSNGSYTESVLYSFLGNYVGSTDGAYPEAVLIMDGSGNLYGTTSSGGSGSCQYVVSNAYLASGQCGTVFKLTKGSNGSYTESVLYSFQGVTNSDGAYPEAGLIMDGNGNLYGTTNEGGTGGCTSGYKVGYTQEYLNVGCGTAFKLTLVNGGGYSESVLYNFPTFGYSYPAFTGYFPSALIMDSGGNLYGTTTEGGTGDVIGTVFELASGGNGSYIESVLHGFQVGTSDGYYPAGGLTMDGSGNLYGATSEGGTAGTGAVFKFTKGSNGSYAESLLYSFDGTGDGLSPSAPLIMDGSGNLYGTTTSGGAAECAGYFNACGTVFEITQ